MYYVCSSLSVDREAGCRRTRGYIIQDNEYKVLLVLSICQKRISRPGLKHDYLVDSAKVNYEKNETFLTIMNINTAWPSHCK